MPVFRDAYDQPVTASSQEALAHYVAAAECMLTGNAGGAEALNNAIDIDEGFALAHAARALFLQGSGKNAEALAYAEREVTRAA
jgi:hypothetical protein